MGCLQALTLHRLLGIYVSLARHRTLSMSSPTENQWPKLNTASPRVSGKWRNAGKRKNSVSADDVAVVASKRRTNRPIGSYLTPSRDVASGSEAVILLHRSRMSAFLKHPPSDSGPPRLTSPENVAHHGWLWWFSTIVFGQKSVSLTLQ